jgi:simple sugar transport system substrate-binding protein
MVKKVLCLLICGGLFFGACERNKETPKGGSLSVLVYITGVRAGSPPYELLAAGAEAFAEANEQVKVKIYEAGFNQAEWEEQLSSLIADGEYDLVLGSNPSLPEICARVGEQFPRQRFIITDAWYQGNPQISTWLYNQYEQAVYLGYLAGLITTSGMPGANPAKKVGFIAAQEYPLLARHIIPGFIEGARLADPAISLDTRIIGNWFDANKAADLASSMIDAEVDVFTAIAGGAAQGMIKTAKDKGAYVVFFNTNEYAQAPGIIVGCGLMEQKKLVMEILSGELMGKTAYGTAATVGAKEGYLDFIAADPGYREHLPAGIQEQFDFFMEQIRSGAARFEPPPL